MYTFTPTLVHPHSVQAAVADVNTAVRADAPNPAGLLSTLKSQYTHFEGVQDSQAPHYVTLLRAARAAKAEVRGGALGFSEHGFLFVGVVTC